MAEIRHLITIKAPPTAVYETIAKRDRLKEWWTADIEGDDSEGGLLQMGFFERSTVYRMRVEKLASGREVAWKCEGSGEWEGTRVHFSLEPDDGQTVLRFRHVDWRQETEYFWTCNTTWGDLMYRLKAAAEGHPRGRSRYQARAT